MPSSRPQPRDDLPRRADQLRTGSVVALPVDRDRRGRRGRTCRGRRLWLNDVAPWWTVVLVRNHERSSSSRAARSRCCSACAPSCAPTARACAGLVEDSGWANSVWRPTTVGPVGSGIVAASLVPPHRAG